MRSQVLEAHSAWEVMLHQVAGRLGKQHLSSVASAHDACGAVDVQADIALGAKLRLTRMQAYAHPHGHTIRPGMESHGSLRIHCCRDGIGGASKGHKEGISLGIDLVAMVLMESCTQQASALGQHVGVALTQTLEQAGGPFDVSEEEGDCSPREVRHGGRPLSGFDTVCRGKTRRYCLLKGVCHR